MNSKICARCKRELPLRAFPWRWRAANIRQSSCRDCRRLENRLSYQRHAPARRVKQRERNGLRRGQARQYFREFFARHDCVDCSEKDHRVLELDFPADLNSLTISSMITKCYSLERIETIVEQAEVRCANCLRKRRHSL